MVSFSFFWFSVDGRAYHVHTFGEHVTRRGNFTPVATWRMYAVSS